MMIHNFPTAFTSADEAYHYTVSRVLNLGQDRGDRTGTGTRAVFGHNVEIDLSGGTLPVVSLKKTRYQDAIAELIWMLSGSNSLVPLIEQGIHIWTDWPLKAYNLETGENIGRDEFEARVLADPEFAEKWGTIAPCYGTEMRSFESSGGAVIDQFQQLVDEIKSNGESRRLIWSLWRPEFVTVKGGTGLPPCHFGGAVNVTNGELSIKLRLRSSDVGLGWPYNVAQYGYLLHLLAALTDNKPGMLVVDIDDCHIYQNHIDGMTEVLERECRTDPKFIWKRKPTSLDDLSLDDFEVVGYEPQGFIKLPVAV
ncbi:thymidylate synthase [Erythrobacter aureus]|uniref:Thymidylate synthase n=1 Tax=Erythrobacter aureus TaxID=2182384 RepID=A0A345YIG7_9SPHN|nr:thymidylate synthase [Erythrobacter aureus]AXK43719.1 thymidylate synthase [Erythrobacter aureus]